MDSNDDQALRLEIIEHAFETQVGRRVYSD